MSGFRPDRFDVVLVGDQSDHRLVALKSELERRTEELERLGDEFKIAINDPPSGTDRVAGACIVFGSAAGSDTSALEPCVKVGMHVFPVVADLADFAQQIPSLLHHYNGFQMKRDESSAELAGLVLEALGLQRGRRKIFISYARLDSASVARQLRDALGQRWYSVFLDTVSIRPGRRFQAELEEQLADSDIFLFLDSPNASERPFVREELEFAFLAGLGQIQLLWPGQPQLQQGGISHVVPLEPADFETETQALSPAKLAEVLLAVAKERTFLQLQRDNDINRTIEDYAKRHGFTLRRHIGRYVDLSKGGSTVRLDINLGLPTSMELAVPWSVPNLPAQSPKQTVYQPLGLTDETEAHLKFLSNCFPIRLLHLSKSETWPDL